MGFNWYVVRCKVCGFDVYFNLDVNRVFNYLVQCSHCRNVHDLRDPLRIVDPSETGVLVATNNSEDVSSAVVPFQLSPLCRLHVEHGGVSAQEQLRSIVDIVDQDMAQQRRSQGGGGGGGGMSYADDMANQQMRRFTRAMMPVLQLFSFVDKLIIRKLGSIRGSAVSAVELKFLRLCTTSRSGSGNNSSVHVFLLAPTSSMLYPLAATFIICWYLVRFVFLVPNPSKEGVSGEGGSVYGSTFCAIVDVSVLGVLISLVTCTFTDPGYILPGSGTPPPPFGDGTTIPTNLAEVESGNSLWCSACNHMRPPRAHHCYVCGLCVEEHDHHCQVTGACIGHRNLRPFVSFCFFATIATAMGAHVTINFLLHSSDHFWMMLLGLFASVWIIPMAIVLPIFLAIVLYGIARNRTQRERRRPELQNPANDKGFVRNCWHFLAATNSNPSIATHPNFESNLQTL